MSNDSLWYDRNMKKIIIFLIVVTGFIVFFVVSQKDEVVSEGEVVFQEPSSLCYYNETLTQTGLYDRSWLRLNLSANEVSGEYYNLPAEKDGKFGELKGTFSKDDFGVLSRADVIWEAKAEGSIVSEQLLINFTRSEAFVGFGEMKLGYGGLYVYSDPQNISYWQPLLVSSCEDLDERIVVEKYIRENIKTIASQEPVLGGSWYVVSVSVDPLQNTSTATYEDGHIQNTETFTYEIADGAVVVKKEI